MKGVRLKPGEWGEISIKKLATGTYEAQCRYMDPSGVLSRSRKRGKTYADARRSLEALLRPASTYSAETVGELLSLWLAKHQGIVDATRERYQADLDRYLLPNVGSIKVEDFTPGLAQQAIDQVALSYSRDAAKHARGRLRQACKWGVRMECLPRDVSAETIIPGRADRKRAFAPGTDEMTFLRDLLYEELKARKNGPRSDNHIVACEIIVATGARISEACALDWNPDINFVDETVSFRDGYVEENGKLILRGHLKNQDPIRVNHMTERLKGILAERAQSTGPVLVSRNGTRIQPSNIRRAWRRAYEWAGYRNRCV